MFSIILSLILFCGAIALPSDNSKEQSPGVGNISRSVDAYLSSRGSDSGLLQILLPNQPTAKHVCYPANFRQNQETARLLHVLCRQLGFVTFGTRYKEIFETDHSGILSTSAECTGRETHVSECPWQNIQRQTCRKVLGARCSSCYKKIFATNGVIHNPGFPHAYLYPMTCDWTIQVAEDKGILLTFEQFALPRHKEFVCESYLELAYGYQKQLKNRRICPLDLPDTIRIPYNTVRIRFSSGIFREEYERQQTHYGFNIIFKSIKLETPDNHILKVILISTAFVMVFLVCVCCFFCRRSFHSTHRNIRHTGLSQAPTQEQLHNAVDLKRYSTQIPLHSEVYKGNDQKTMNFSIFQSESSSPGSVVARWRSNTDLPVTSALAPLGPDRRMVSVAMTPRSVFPESPRKWSEECAKRIEQVRTKLVARFSTTSSHNQSDISVFFPAQERRSYSKLSNEDEMPLKEIGFNRNSVAFNKPVPSIVIEFVE